MRFDIQTVVIPLFLILCYFFFLLDVHGVRVRYHRNRLKRIARKYDASVSDENLSLILNKIVRTISFVLEARRKKEDAYIEKFGIYYAGRIKRSGVIINIPLSFEIDRIKKSAKICGITL